eukprot:gene293-501_t
MAALSMHHTIPDTGQVCSVGSSSVGSSTIEAGLGRPTSRTDLALLPDYAQIDLNDKGNDSSTEQFLMYGYKVVQCSKRY